MLIVGISVDAAARQLDVDAWLERGRTLELGRPPNQIHILTRISGVTFDEALDRERRLLMRAAWPDVLRPIASLSLHDAHRLVLARADGLLPCALPEEGPE